MRLKNKRTGEIVEFRYLQSDHVAPLVLTTYENDNPEMYSYTSLAELNAEWEDYEEPKEDGLDHIITLVEAYSDHDSERYPKEIVEKLKAWKRLKDKGFRFILDGETEMPMFVYSGANKEKCITSAEESKQCRDDIKLLFGGEE